MGSVMRWEIPVVACFFFKMECWEEPGCPESLAGLGALRGQPQLRHRGQAWLVAKRTVSLQYIVSLVNMAHIP